MVVEGQRFAVLGECAVAVALVAPRVAGRHQRLPGGEIGGREILAVRRRPGRPVGEILRQRQQHDLGAGCAQRAHDVLEIEAVHHRAVLAFARRRVALAAGAAVEDGEHLLRLVDVLEIDARGVFVDLLIAEQRAEQAPQAHADQPLAHAEEARVHVDEVRVVAALGELVVAVVDDHQVRRVGDELVGDHTQTARGVARHRRVGDLDAGRRQLGREPFRQPGGERVFDAVRHAGGGGVAEHDDPIGPGRLLGQELAVRVGLETPRRGELAAGRDAKDAHAIGALGG